MVRIKERYLLVNILYPSAIGTKPDVPDVVVINQPTTDKLTAQALLRGIRDEVSNLFGDYGAGSMEGGGLSVKYLSAATSTFILRITRAHYRLLWTALTMMDHVPVHNGKPCTFRVVHVSGTIRKAEEAAIRCGRDLMFAAREQSGNKDSSVLETILGLPSRSRRQAAPKAANPLAVKDASDDEEMLDYHND
jgi:ribonuclease P/MRP protein subunit POP5